MNAKAVVIGLLVIVGCSGDDDNSSSGAGAAGTGASTSSSGSTGCPADMGVYAAPMGSCTTEGDSCFYGDTSCVMKYSCTQGQWANQGCPMMSTTGPGGLGGVGGNAGAGGRMGGGGRGGAGGG